MKRKEDMMEFLTKNIPKKEYYVKDISGKCIKLKQNETIPYILGQFRTSNYAVLETRDNGSLIVEKNHEWLDIEYKKKGPDERIIERIIIEKRFI